MKSVGGEQERAEFEACFLCLKERMSDQHAGTNPVVRSMSTCFHPSGVSLTR